LMVKYWSIIGVALAPAPEDVERGKFSGAGWTKGLTLVLLGPGTTYQIKDTTAMTGSLWQLSSRYSTIDST